MTVVTWRKGALVSFWSAMLAIAVALGIALWLASLHSGDRDLVPRTVSPARGTEHRFAASESAFLECDDAREGSGAVEGTVLDTGGRPLADVAVQLRRAGPTRGNATFATVVPAAPKAPSPFLAVTRSGIDGRFRISGLAHMTRYAVEAVPEALLWGSRTVVETSPGRDAYALLVVGKGSSIVGRVVDADDQGVHAWVSARASPRWAVRDVETDGEGRFRLSLVPDGVVRFTAFAPGQARLEDISVLVPHKGEVILRLGQPGGGSVTGRVANLDGQPIARARVTVTTKPAPWRGGWHRYTRHTLTDLDGRYRVSGLPPGVLYHVQVEAAGYVGTEGPVPLETQPRPIRSGEIISFDVTLNRGATVAGRVIDTEGRPIAGASVRLMAIRPPHGLLVACGHTLPRAVTGVDGAFHFRGVPLEKITITARREGFDVRMSPTVDASAEGAQLQAEVVMAAQEPPIAGDSVIRGRALGVDGRAVPGAVVVASFGGAPSVSKRFTRRHQAHCDEAGAFVIDGVVSQVPWRLGAYAAGHVSESVAPVVPDKGCTVTVNLVLRPAGVIAGHVVGPDGRPLVGVDVEGRIDGKTRLSGKSGVLGRFRFEDVKPGAYELVPVGERSSPIGKSLALGLAEGARHENLILRASDVYYLAGIVVDLSGSRVPHMTVEAKRPRAVVGRSTSTDPAGRFRIRFFSQGSYHLLVGGRMIPGVFDTGQLHLRLVYEPSPPSRLVEVVLRDADGRAVPRGEVWIRTGPQFLQKTKAWMGGGRFCAEIDAEVPRVDIEVSSARDATGRLLDLEPMRVTDVDPAASPIEVRLKSR